MGATILSPKLVMGRRYPAGECGEAPPRGCLRVVEIGIPDQSPKGSGSLAETEGFEPSMRFWHILP